MTRPSSDRPAAARPGPPEYLPPESPPAVRCSQLVRIYRSATGETHALRGVDATFPAHSVTAVVGPSGSGKSSLLSILALRDRPSGGRVWLGGDLVPASDGRLLRALRRHRVSWVPQRPSEGLYPHLTAAQHVRVASRLRSTTDRTADGARDVLARLGLDRRADDVPGRLSGGEQQRLVVGMAAAAAAPVVVADEPTAELDEASAALVLAELARLAAAGSCVVLATHDADAVDRASRVLLLRHGVLSTDGGPRHDPTAVIDAAGRVQLPPEVLDRFPGGRALVRPDGSGVRLLPVEREQR